MKQNSSLHLKEAADVLLFDSFLLMLYLLYVKVVDNNFTEGIQKPC